MAEAKKKDEQILISMREELNEHNYRYHVLDNPTVSDSHYDKLFRALEELEKKYPELNDPNSPTKRVGAAPIEKFNSITHPTPMLSLNNAFNVEEVIEFDRRCREGSGQKNLTYVVEPKLDGLAVNLIYKDGKLLSGATRGDGRDGEDVTENVRSIKSIPLLLRGRKYPSLLEVRGEVFISIKDFEDLNKEKFDQKENLMQIREMQLQEASASLIQKLPLKDRSPFFVMALDHGLEIQYQQHN